MVAKPVKVVAKPVKVVAKAVKVVAKVVAKSAKKRSAEGASGGHSGEVELITYPLPLFISA